MLVLSLEYLTSLSKTSNILFDDIVNEHNATPKYLSVTLDRSLTYEYHPHKTAAEVNTGNNILPKLFNTSWGSTTKTFRCHTMVLVYSAAELYSPAWLNIRLDKHLNTTMQYSAFPALATLLFPNPSVRMLYSVNTRRSVTLLTFQFMNPYLPPYKVY